MKPEIIEAFQMTRGRRSDNADWPGWMSQAWQKDPAEEGSLSCVDFPNSDGTDHLQIRMSEGTRVVEWGDYIVRSVNHELCSCAPGIVEAIFQG